MIYIRVLLLYIFFCKIILYFYLVRSVAMARTLRSSKVARLQTRVATSLLDGELKKKRQQAERDIAEAVCRHAVVKAGTQKLSIPRNKLSEVFDWMVSRVYTEYHCKLSRVKGLVYEILRKREEEYVDSMDDSTSGEEDNDATEDEVRLF